MHIFWGIVWPHGGQRYSKLHFIGVWHPTHSHCLVLGKYGSINSLFKVWSQNVQFFGTQVKFNVPLHVSVGKDLATLMAKGFRNWSPPNYFKFKFPYNLMHWENYHNVFIWTCTRNLGGLQFIKTPCVLHPTGWSFLLKPLCIYLVQNHFIT